MSINRHNTHLVPMFFSANFLISRMARGARFLNVILCSRLCRLIVYSLRGGGGGGGVRVSARRRVEPSRPLCSAARHGPSQPHHPLSKETEIDPSTTTHRVTTSVLGALALFPLAMAAVVGLPVGWSIEVQEMGRGPSVTRVVMVTWEVLSFVA